MSINFILIQDCHFCCPLVDLSFTFKFVWAFCDSFLSTRILLLPFQGVRNTLSLKILLFFLFTAVISNGDIILGPPKTHFRPMFHLKTNSSNKSVIEKWLSQKLKIICIMIEMKTLKSFIFKTCRLNTRNYFHLASRGESPIHFSVRIL